MKILVYFTVIGLVAYAYISGRLGSKKHKKISRREIGIIIGLIGIFLGFGVLQAYLASMQPDTQCTAAHIPISRPHSTPTTAMDYFLQGNYDYDRGSCVQAIIDYTKAIKHNPNFSESYNNRAYTYMRIQDYSHALGDLNTALKLRPNYIQALMNRGDIHNFYYAIDRQSAINDYEKVISLGGTHGTSVCGHLMMAKHNGWHVSTLIDFPREIMGNCNY